MNKKILAIYVLFLISLNQNFCQQSLTLSFEARHYEGKSIGLDSILIKNINRNCDTTLYAPDTILFYNFFVGIEEEHKPKASFLSNAYPNPAINNKSFFNIKLKKAGILKLELFDLMGRELFTKNYNLAQGSYKYQISLGNAKTYILNAVFENGIQTIKIINNSNNSGENNKIELISSHTLNKLKQDSNNNGFWYEPGDTLWYIGYAITPQAVSGSDVIEGIPIISEHIGFTIIEGVPCKNSEAVKYHGHLYPTVQIGEQCWFKENLNIGAMISGDSTMSDNGVVEKYCYDDDILNCDEYGGLYQWHELMNYSEDEGTQGICPEGWHIPTEFDYMDLKDGYSGSEFKERGNQHWLPGYNNGGTNLSGYTAYASGYRQIDKKFYQQGQDAPYSSSTKLTYDWVWFIEFNVGNIIFYGTTKKEAGNAVRCIKN